MRSRRRTERGAGAHKRDASEAMREAEREFGSGPWIPAGTAPQARLAVWPRDVWRQNRTGPGPRISCARTRRMIAERIIPGMAQQSCGATCHVRTRHSVAGA
eukprot:1052415-Rhodomonas_salina.1